MVSTEIRKVISKFTNSVYPKGHGDRGFAIACLSIFISWLEDAGYEIVKKK